MNLNALPLLLLFLNACNSMVIVTKCESKCFATLGNDCLGRQGSNFYYDGVSQKCKSTSCTGDASYDPIIFKSMQECMEECSACPKTILKRYRYDNPCLKPVRLFGTKQSKKSISVWVFSSEDGKTCVDLTVSMSDWRVIFGYVAMTEAECNYTCRPFAQ